MRKSKPNRVYEAAAQAQGYVQIAGVDEAGRGPLAGPVVAAACILPPTYCLLGLNDSKLLTAEQREQLFASILQQGLCGIGIVSHEWIDRINILQATHRAMRLAVQQLPLQPDYILVDGPFVSFSPISSEGIIGGDGLSDSIAAASILAKVVRDRIMYNYDRLYPHYGYAQHKGYGTLAHRRAIETWGRSPIQRNFSIRPLA